MSELWQLSALELADLVRQFEASPLAAHRFGDHTALAAAQVIEDAVEPLTPIDPVVG